MRKVPNIDLGTTLKKRDRQGFKEFVLQINTDTFIYDYSPNLIELIDGIYFRLYLLNKRFIFDILEVDNVKDYIDVYLYGVKQPQNRYEVSVDDVNIIITFIEDITRIPADVIATDFKIKGKIAEIV
jgi:EAL domain-containing protein (putative c-di-GMP-specific phosphodiesterase class I)